MINLFSLKRLSENNLTVGKSDRPTAKQVRNSGFLENDSITFVKVMTYV